MNKWNVVYSYNVILFEQKKEWGTNTGYNAGEPWKLCWMKETRHKRSHIILFHLHELSRIGRYIETESRLVIA